MNEEIATRMSVGVTGTLATIGLEYINEAVSVLVGLATFCYMVLSIAKLLRNWNVRK